MDKRLSARVDDTVIRRLFKKELNGDICGAMTPKRLLNTFDSTVRGERPGGEKLDLYRACLLKKFREYLDHYPFRAVVVYPCQEVWRNHQP